MKKLALAFVLALPLSALAPAAADADCYNLSAGFHIKFCGSSYCKAWREKECCGGGCGPGCGSGGCNGGYGPGCGSGGNGGGPWYTYWPYDGATMTTPNYDPNWSYGSNFQVPAPVYPFWPNLPAINAAEAHVPPPPAAYHPAPAPALQPASYQQTPPYWGGR